ncbi:MAG: enoyl-CoA hydratase/isomerase family protein [Dehalococcoidia bacterium]|nr:enoyl-CoA hydratase/isomerase family protein [Dehalococcoidia bacterium]
MFKTILLSRAGPKARIALNRPRAGNRVNPSMTEELAQAAEFINQDDSTRVVTLTGQGQSFSSGWERIRFDSAEELARHRAAGAIARIQKPVVAAINGDAIGQGLELALAADIRIAVATAHFGMPQVRFGVLPWDGGTQRLPRLVGRAHALALLLTGAVIDASEALRIGLVHQVVEPQQLEAATDSAVEQIASTAPVAERYAKETVMKGMDMTLEQGLHLEADLNILLHTTGDRAEGIRSFRERRPPKFSGQ